MNQNSDVSQNPVQVDGNESSQRSEKEDKIINFLRSNTNDDCDSEDDDNEEGKRPQEPIDERE